MDRTGIARARGTAESKRKLPASEGSAELVAGFVKLIEQGRLTAARCVNVVLTSTYWLVGRRIVEHEQKGSKRAGYGEEVLKRLSKDLTSKLYVRA